MRIFRLSGVALLTLAVSVGRVSAADPRTDRLREGAEATTLAGAYPGLDGALAEPPAVGGAGPFTAAIVGTPTLSR